MTLLHAYLSKSKVKKTLALKPGQEGFSLIELVVVVAVLAVLSAIAIPQFTNISNKARTAAAMNTVATVAKECAAKIADQGIGNDSQYRPPITIDGYKEIIPGTAATANAAAIPDTEAGWYQDSVIVDTTGGTSVNLGNRAATPALINCPNNGTIGLLSENQQEYPSFYYEITTGRKYCEYDVSAGDPYPAAERGCTCTGTPLNCSW